MRVFRDIEQDTNITEEELKEIFDNVLCDYDKDGMNFYQYIAECCGKNGSLEELRQ